jgi:hypothetical protein
MIATEGHCSTIGVHKSAPLHAISEVPFVPPPLKEERFQMLNPGAPRFLAEQLHVMRKLP